MFNNVFNGLFGKIQPGMCRLSPNGGIAVKTSNGYKTYNVDTGRLTNCDNFVFDIGEDLFFVLPTNKVKKGDIILVSGKPKCVIKEEGNTITVLSYEDSTIDTVIPERHMFMGNTYMYGRVTSLFGNNFKGKGMGNMMKFMMMSEMMKGNSGGSTMNNMLPLMMIGGDNFGDMFDGMFDFCDEDNGSEVEE